MTEDFVDLYRGLEAVQLDALSFHRRGPRSVRWYAAHRLAEVAFHRWDLQFSLGWDPQLDDEVAALLLPTLIASNAPSTYAAALAPPLGQGERYLLVTSDTGGAGGPGTPSARWLVKIDSEQLQVSPGGGTADLTITGSPAVLALLVYGRRDLSSLAASGALRLEGDLTLVDRFAVTFPKP